MTIQEEYKQFLENCTKFSKTAEKYMVFTRVNKTIASILKVDCFDLYSCTDADEYESLLQEILSNEEFQAYNTKGKEQYSNALQQYLYFLKARKLFLSVSYTPSGTALSTPLQQIFYGAPGTGKSHTINQETREKDVVRTTFHPDSDYSTFVGAYKPTTVEETVMTVIGTKAVPVENPDGSERTEAKIVYEFVAQAFLKAYVAAWKKQSEAGEGKTDKREYLVIEEINRGNCAQIFGDLFQLLDRNAAGFSDYPIQADKDMQKQLAKAFRGLSVPQREAINALYDGKDIVAQVLNGDILLLPNNLYIWATMNTSDQSLFPIDSAFKRRWDWTYVPIADAHKGWRIKVANAQYDWWQFLEKINHKIGETTNSEDKKLGYFFCKANNEGVITAETFVGKVIFYLWNDVFKDYEFSDTIFNDEDGGKLTFDKFHVAVGQKAEIVESKVQLFLQNLGLEPVGTENPVAAASEEEEA